MGIAGGKRGGGGGNGEGDGGGGEGGGGEGDGGGGEGGGGESGGGGDELSVHTYWALYEQPVPQQTATSLASQSRIP